MKGIYNNRLEYKSDMLSMYETSLILTDLGREKIAKVVVQTSRDVSSPD